MARPRLKTDARGNVPAVAYARKSLGAKIARKRREIGWTQRKLAEAAGVSLATVRDAERGTRRMPVATIDTLDAAMGFG